MAKFEPPKGLPTVFDESFKGCGQKVGVEIWRIEKFQVVKKPASDPSYKGQFHDGDSYILLQTKQRQSALERHIFFWLGKNSSQDEQGAAAYKTVELDTFLGGEPVQHREVQQHESDEFLALFKEGVTYLEGGVESGFKKVDKDAYTTKLWHVKGRRNIRIFQVELSPASMNDGDVFILDCGMDLFQWNGKNSSKLERTKALSQVQKIRDQERSGKAKIHVVDQDKDSDDEFWRKFGVKKTPIKTGADDDEAHSRGLLEKTKLFHISDSTGSMKVDEVTARPLKKELLKGDDAYMLDVAGLALFVWIGKGASQGERLHSMKYATDFLKQKGYPNWTPITRLAQDGETPAFKDNFENWPDVSANPLYKTSDKKKFEKKSFSAAALHVAQEREKQSLPDDGTGKVEVWRIENFEKVPYPKELYGHFFGGDSYLIFYTYLVNSKENYIIYFWQGLTSSQDEKGASALLAKDLDDQYGGAPVQVRVVQNKEPAHFYLIFKGKMIVHSGGKASGFKNRNDIDSIDTDGTRLYQIRGTNPLNTRAIQVPELAANLNSGDVFILETPKKVYLWCGTGASGDEREFAKGISKEVSRRDYELTMEGKETDEFWSALGGKTEYAQSKVVDEYREPRLFQATNAVGYFRIEEIFDFDQEDLVEDDVMILDTYREVYIWIGGGSNAEERKKSLESATEYVKTDKSGRKVDDTTFITVKQGFEPLGFTSQFHAWDANKWSHGKSYLQLKAELGGGDLTTSLASELDKYSGGKSYPYDVLVRSVPDGVDPLHKEMALSDDEFQKYLGVSKLEYAKLPAWKANNLKKKAKLY